MIYCYANGIFSSRRIERATHRDIGVRFVAANRHPDHDTIARFRRENFAAVSESFLQVLLLAKELKLLRVGLVSVDGSKFKANASKHRSVTYERAGALIANWKARSRRFWAGRRRQTRLARMIPRPCRRRLPAARPCATSSMRPVAVWRRRLRRGRQRSTRPTRPKWRRGRSAGVVPRASIRSRRPSLAEDAPGARDGRGAERGRAHAVRQGLEQPAAEARLEPGDVPGEGGWVTLDRSAAAPRPWALVRLSTLCSPPALGEQRIVIGYQGF